MDSLHIAKCTLLAFGFLTIGACSKSGETGSEIDDRITIEQFVQNKPEEHSAEFITEITENSIQAANQALNSLTLDRVYLNPNNVVITPWPIISTFALVTTASNGDTANEITLELNEFGLDHSWSLASNALHESFLKTGVTTIDNDIWSQLNSQFEPDFLAQLYSALRPGYFDADFLAGENISSAINEAAMNTFGAVYELEANNTADTRLIMLNQMKTEGLFDVESLQIEAFDGLFLDYSGSALIRAPMIRFQGNMDYYENSEFVAFRIPVADNQLSLISIQPKSGNFDYLRIPAKLNFDSGGT